MCRIKLGASAFFKLFVAAATLALGLAAASLWPRQSPCLPAPPAPAAPARAEVSVRNTFEKTGGRAMPVREAARESRCLQAPE
jgi:hypothetical protein